MDGNVNHTWQKTTTWGSTWQSHGWKCESNMAKDYYMGGPHGNLFSQLKYICHVYNDPDMTINYTCHKSKSPQYDYHNIYIQMLYSQFDYIMII
jgi:hypothetical protein